MALFMKSLAYLFEWLRKHEQKISVFSDDLKVTDFFYLFVNLIETHFK